MNMLRYPSLMFFCLFLSAGSIAADVSLQDIADRAHLTLELARKGGYGRLSAGQINMILAAHNRIVKLADSNKSLNELDKLELSALEYSRARLDKLTKSVDKDRLVCRKVIKTGTRLIKSECLSVAQREERARAAQLAAEQIQRVVCGNDAPNCGGGN